MSKIVNIITNISNGAGLQKDAELFANLLEKLGHKPRLIAYDRPHDGISYPADINFFMEVLTPICLFGQAKENWFMPNSEWFGKEYEPNLGYIHKVLCKTHDCYNIWNRRLPGKCVYTGFESADLSTQILCKDKEVNFLHLAGNSGTKNTEAVIDAWRQFRFPYNLEIVAREPDIRIKSCGIPNVSYHQRIPDNQVQMALNVRLFHLMPSQYEGFGHSIHEALGCGQIVITTDAPPMNEFPGIAKELLIPSSGTYMRHLALCHYVTPAGIKTAVEKAIALSEVKREELSIAARAAFLKDREAFRNKITDLFQ